MPKLSIPRMAMEGVWTCIKATPFSSGLKNTVSNVGQLRSERMMLGVDDGGSTTGSGLSGRMSPPLFPRNADAQGRGPHRVHAEANGIDVLKDVLKPAFMDVDVDTQEKEDMMENMRIAEGWRECQPEALYIFLILPPFFLGLASIPLDSGPSSTPPMTADMSRRSAEEDENEDVLQIDELMLPSSPPFGNKELKELFRSRMGMCPAVRTTSTETTIR
jgi:hypothetical protein